MKFRLVGGPACDVAVGARKLALEVLRWGALSVLLQEENNSLFTHITCAYEIWNGVVLGFFLRLPSWHVPAVGSAAFF